MCYFSTLPHCLSSMFYFLSLYLAFLYLFHCLPTIYSSSLTTRHFEVVNKEEVAARIFSVPDFVGDACKAIASRVRGAVAGVQFDDFHKARYLLF